MTRTVFVNTPIPNGSLDLRELPSQGVGIWAAEALNELAAAAPTPHLWNTVAPTGDLRIRTDRQDLAQSRHAFEARLIAAKYPYQAPPPIVTDADCDVAETALELIDAELVASRLALCQETVPVCARRHRHRLQRLQHRADGQHAQRSPQPGPSHPELICRAICQEARRSGVRTGCPRAARMGRSVLGAVRVSGLDAWSRLIYAGCLTHDGLFGGGGLAQDRQGGLDQRSGMYADICRRACWGLLDEVHRLPDRCGDGLGPLPEVVAVGPVSR